MFESSHNTIFFTLWDLLMSLQSLHFTVFTVVLREVQNILSVIDLFFETPQGLRKYLPLIHTHTLTAAGEIICVFTSSQRSVLWIKKTLSFISVDKPLVQLQEPKTSQSSLHVFHG